MDFIWALALSSHLGMAGDYNEIHPHVRFIEDEYINVVIQINGKKRGLLNLKKDTDEKELLSLIKKDEKLNKYIENKIIKKQIFVKNKIMSLII